MPHEENFTRADWLSLGESGVSCGHGRLFLCGGFLGAAVTCAGLVRDLCGTCLGSSGCCLGVCSVAEYQDEEDEDAYGGEEEASKVQHGEKWGNCQHS